MLLPPKGRDMLQDEELGVGTGAGTGGRGGEK
jgi:hypothetical protein